MIAAGTDAYAYAYAMAGSGVRKPKTYPGNGALGWGADKGD